MITSGVSSSHLLVRQSDFDIDNTLDVNLRGSIMMTRAVLGRSVGSGIADVDSSGMIMRRSGRIVLVGSAITSVGVPGSSVYAASKAALVGIVYKQVIFHNKHGIY